MNPLIPQILLNKISLTKVRTCVVSHLTLVPYKQGGSLLTRLQSGNSIIQAKLSYQKVRSNTTTPTYNRILSVDLT